MRTQDRGHDGQAGVGFGAACVAHAEHLEGWEADWVFGGHFGWFFPSCFFVVGGGVMAAAMASRALGCCRSSFEVDDERCDAGWSRKISGHVVISTIDI